MNYYKYITEKNTDFKLSPIAIFLSLAIILMLSSCVSQNKYNASLNNLAELKKEKAVDSIMYAKKIAAKNKQIENQLYSMKQQNQLILDKMNRMDSIEKVLKAEKEYLSQTQSIIEKLKTKEWEVEQVDGMLMIQLDDNILFKTGSTTISNNGMELIKDISSVVNNGIKENVKIWVAGHTDDNKYNSNNFNNWDLSAQRALTVVKEFENNDIKPWKLTALARSMYSPLVPNRSNALRKKNRRTEIYIIPDDMKTI